MLRSLPLLALALGLAACSPDPAPAAPSDAPADGGEVVLDDAPRPSAGFDSTELAGPATGVAADGDLVPTAVTVYKTPTCGCCSLWGKYLEREGFAVTNVDVDDLGAVKDSLGVPPQMGSCHTATVEGYVIEGHVPAGPIRRLLAERPDARGLAVPGMPIGSPGMEQGDLRQPYDVFLVSDTGETRVYDSIAGGS